MKIQWQLLEDLKACMGSLGLQSRLLTTAPASCRTFKSPTLTNSTMLQDF